YHVLTPAPPLVLLFLPTLLPPPRSTLFPYTTLFRSLEILRAGPGRRRRVFLLDRRLGSFRRGSARRLGHRRRRRLEPGRLLELGCSPIQVDDADRDQDDSSGLDRQLHRPREEQRAEQALRPGRRSRGLQHPIDEPR